MIAMTTLDKMVTPLILLIWTSPVWVPGLIIFGWLRKMSPERRRLMWGVLGRIGLVLLILGMLSAMLLR